MAHKGFKGSVVEEQPDSETIEQSSVETPPKPQTPPEWVDWSEVEKDPRYSKAAPQQQEAVRQKYWDEFLTADPRISGLEPERQQQIMEKFVRPPGPEGTVEKVVKKVVSGVQKSRELDPTTDVLNYFVTEAVGGTLAAGGGGLNAVFQGLVKGDTSIMPEVYTTTRDTLRKYLVAEPTTESGKKAVEKLSPIASWPFEKVDQGIKAVEDTLFERMESRYGTDQAAAISLAIGEGLRGTLIYGTLGLGGKFGGPGSLERKADIPEAGQLQLEGPPTGQLQLEGPNLFERPDERYRRAGEAEVLQQGGPTEPKLLEGPVQEGGEPSITPEPIAPPRANVQGIEGEIIEGSYRIITPEPVAKPSILGMSIEELRTAILTDDLTGLPSRRAYDEAPKKPVQVINDVDGLKYINDNFGHEAGDALIKTVAQIAKEEGLDVYRAGKGADEFVIQANSTGEAYQALGRLQERLGKAIIEAEKPDGTKVRLKGLAFSYGVGKNLTEADKQLAANKATREQKGLRAERGGRPPSLEEVSVEVTKGDKVSGVATKVEKAPTPPPSVTPEPPRSSSSPVGVGGGPDQLKDTLQKLVDSGDIELPLSVESRNKLRVLGIDPDQIKGTLLEGVDDALVADMYKQKFTVMDIESKKTPYEHFIESMAAINYDRQRRGEPKLPVPSREQWEAPVTLLTPEPPIPVEGATLKKTRLDMIREAAERYQAKKRGLPPPVEPPVVEIKPKAMVTEPGPSPRMARPEKGLPIVRVTEEEFNAEIRRSKMGGDISIEETGLGGAIRLYSGLPLDEATALAKVVIKKLRGQIGTKYRVGQDLSMFQVAVDQVVTPSFLSKVDPIAADFVAQNQALRHGVYYRTAVDYNTKIDKIVKNLTPDEKALVGRLLDSFHDISEVPLALLDARRDITPKVLDAFTAFRDNIFEPLWAQVSGTTPPGKLPGKVHEYFTRVYEDFLQSAGPHKDRYDAMIRTFAEENGLDYADAYRIFHKQVPNTGFFGPVSKSRTAEAKEAGRIWDVEKVARMYVAGVSRKMYLDQMLPQANKALEGIKHPRVRDVMRNYIDRQRGVPDSALRSLLQAHPTVAKIARFEALRQYTSKLGGRPVLAIINATQYPLLDGTKAISRALFEEKGLGPMHNFVKGALDVFTAEGRALIDRSGVRLGPTGWTPDPRSIRGGMEKIAHYAGWMHRMVDEYSRAASYLRNYYDAELALNRMRMEEAGFKQKSGVWYSKSGIELGPAGIKGLEDKGVIKKLLPEEEFMLKNLYAIKGVAETQFFYDVSGAPAMYSNPLLANLGRFKQYTINMAGLVANLSGRDLLIFMGMLQMAGGPDANPLLRQVYAQLRRKHPDSLATKVFNGLQEFSVAGVTGLDIGEQVGFGFIPGASTDEATFQNFRDDFWNTVGRQVQGPTVGDINNLFKDLETGKLSNLEDFLGSKSAGGISVTMQKGMRGLKEWDDRYVEWSRGRKGVELSKKDVIARALGIDTTAIARRQQEYAAWNSEVDEAISEKQKIEDSYVKFIKDVKQLEQFQLGEREASARMMDITDRMQEFNQKYGTTLGVFVTSESVREAVVNSYLDPETRMGRSRLQQSLLKGRLDPYRETEE